MAQVYRGGRLHGTGRPDRLTPYDARTRTFDPRRRGVDPGQVRDFQHAVADELTLLHRELATLAELNDRLRRALRSWQVMHERECRPAEEHHRNERPW